MMFDVMNLALTLCHFHSDSVVDKIHSILIELKNGMSFDRIMTNLTRPKFDELKIHLLNFPWSYGTSN
jgi:hypothetical protein